MCPWSERRLKIVLKLVDQVPGRTQGDVLESSQRPPDAQQRDAHNHEDHLVGDAPNVGMWIRDEKTPQVAVDEAYPALVSSASSSVTARRQAG
jgi:hypothetical protein